MASLLDRLSYAQIAKSIDHSLLRPELDDAFVTDGCKLAVRYDVASATVRPSDVARARALLDGSNVKVGTVIGFPHGSSTTATKVFEARRALEEGATEVDMVIDIAALRSGRDDHVREQIAAVAEVAHASGAIVKVIMERRRFRQDLDRFRANWRDARGPGPDATDGFPTGAGQGRRRCAHTRCVAASPGAGRHPRWRHGHRGHS